MDELDIELTEKEVTARRNESLFILCPLNFKDELLKLEIWNGCSSTPLRDYKPTDEELRLIEAEIIEQMRLAISAQDLRLDLNSKVIEWVFTHLKDQATITTFTARGYEWELSQGRFNTIVQWLNPQRDQDGQQRYYNANMSNSQPGSKGVQSCNQTLPLEALEALAWAYECVEDDEFLNFYGVPIPTNPIDLASNS